LHTELEYVRVAHRLALVGGELDLTFECKNRLGIECDISNGGRKRVRVYN
jgi:hypothetical protein